MNEKISQDLEKFANIPNLKNAVTFFGSARLKEDNFYFAQAKKLANLCVENGFCVISGGGGGIMRAANAGAFECKNNANSIKSVGFNILLPHEQKLNDFVELSFCPTIKNSIAVFANCLFLVRWKQCNRLLILPFNLVFSSRLFPCFHLAESFLHPFLNDKIQKFL